MLAILALIVFIFHYSIKQNGPSKDSIVYKCLYKIFSDYSGIDKAFRVIQYLCIGYIGYLEEESAAAAGHATLFLASQLNQIKKVAASSNAIRKMVRFIRAPILFSSLKTRKINLKLDDKVSQFATLFVLCLFISDSADLLFYVTDHYSFLTSMGILSNKMLFHLCDNLGNYLWVIGAIAQIISILTKAYMLKMEGQCLDFRKSNTPYWLIGDLLAACIQTFVGFTFINPNLASKKVFATLILIGCAFKLTKTVVI